MTDGGLDVPVVEISVSTLIQQNGASTWSCTPGSAAVFHQLLCFQAGSSGQDEKLLQLYKLLQELTEEEKQLKQRVWQSEAEVAGWGVSRRVRAGRAGSAFS